MESSLGFKTIFIFHILFSLTPGCYRVDSFPLYRDDQTSGNSVNLHHGIPECRFRAFWPLCSVDLPRKQSSKPLPTRLALGGCTTPSPTPPAPLGPHHIPCSTLWGGGGGGGSCLHTPVSDLSTSPKASLKQHMFYHPAGVQTSSEILGCAIPLTEVTWAPVRTENAKTGKWLSPYVSTVLLPPTADPAPTEGIQLWAVLKQDAGSMTCCCM